MTEPAEQVVSSTVETPRPPALGILNELSTGTYVSYSRALKELLSNAWDANASDVQTQSRPISTKSRSWMTDGECRKWIFVTGS